MASILKFEPVPLDDLQSGYVHAPSSSSIEHDPYTPFQYAEDESTKSLRQNVVDDKDPTQHMSTYLPGLGNPRRHTPSWSLNKSQNWTLELACVFISLACMAALLVLFIYFDKKPLSSWHFYFSLNTVASTLGTTAKSSMLLAVGSAIGQGKWQWFYNNPQPLRDFDVFDEATRGPLGSIRLLWTLRARHLAVLGALVTIISVASDPFLQAVVNYEGRLDNVTLSGSETDPSALSRGFVARANRWAGLNDFAYTQSTSLELDGNTYTSYPKREDFGTSSAFYSGTSSYNDAGLNGSTPYFSCPTGNCTSPIYTSVGVCSKCADISESVRTAEVVDGQPEAYLRSEENFATAFMNFTNYTIPNLWIDNCCVANDSGYTSYMTATLSLRPEDTNAFQDMETMLAAITFLRATPVNGSASKYKDTLPAATECALYLCVNAYQSNVTNGFLTETLVETWATRVPASYDASKEQPSGVEITNASAVHSDVWMPPYQQLYINRSDYQLSVPTDGNKKPTFGPDTTFAVSQAAIVTFQDFMSGMFDSTVGAGNTTRRAHELAYGDAAIPFYTTPIMQPFVGQAHQPVNMTDMFARIAASMTSNVRNAAAAAAAAAGPSSRQPTTVLRYVLHFRVAWPYFALPLGTALLGALYALHTVHRASRPAGPPVWKSSMLASLTHGIDARTRDRLRLLPLDTQRELAARTYVRLRDADGAIELRAAPAAG
ncbi:uncharacterized protein PV09_04386 [Verruconis gallopava]|uniref:Uncharacterized protein n=1 Tax=Verruconis gallopava TaxID=253628 RepID=A0A0D1XPZ7_9PEZI|nr:uncharacterized protein PV09_04386 [Verruconis gallopava]KIW04641.1 hypothetical protein PV09_04386 [Verruconis gallopava]